MPTFSWTSLFTNQNITRDDFITNVRARFDQDEADTVTDSQLIEFIRQGNHDICFETGILPEYATVSLDGSSSYTLPNDMVELKELVYISADSPPAYTLVKPTNLIELNDDGYDSGRIEYFIMNGQSIEVFGAAQNTGTLRAYGTRIPTFPAIGSSYIDIPNQYIELLYLWCEWKFWARRREVDESAVKRNLYFDKIQRVKGLIDQQYSRGVSAYG